MVRAWSDDMSDFVIETDVPLVPAKAYDVGGAKRYPFESMEVGDSFAFEAEAGKGERVRGRAAQYGKAHGKRFVVRIGQGKGRCWRIA
jgi:hypothetical protein